MPPAVTTCWCICVSSCPRKACTGHFASCKIPTINALTSWTHEAHEGCGGARPLKPAENKLLAALSRRERDRLLPHLEPVSLRFEEVLYEPDGPIRHVYFPTSGMISLLVVLDDGLVAQVGRVSNEGMVGLPVFLGVPSSHTRAFVEIPGEALRMKAQVFRQELRRAGALSGLLLRVHPSPDAALGAADGVQHLAYHRAAPLPLAPGRPRPGAGRPVRGHAGVSVANVGRAPAERHGGGEQPPESGLIRYSRGKLTILDRRGLEAAACDCYRAVTRKFSTDCWLRSDGSITTQAEQDGRKSPRFINADKDGVPPCLIS